ATAVRHAGQIDEGALLHLGLEHEELAAGERIELGPLRQRLDASGRRCSTEHRQHQSANKSRRRAHHSDAFNQTAGGDLNRTLVSSHGEGASFADEPLVTPPVAARSRNWTFVRWCARGCGPRLTSWL